MRGEIRNLSTNARQRVVKQSIPTIRIACFLKIGLSVLPLRSTQSLHFGSGLRQSLFQASTIPPGIMVSGSFHLKVISAPERPSLLVCPGLDKSELRKVRLQV